MKIASYSRLFKFIEVDQDQSSDLKFYQSFGLDVFPLQIFNKWHGQYLSQNNLVLRSQARAWNKYVNIQENAQEIFEIVDMLVHWMHPLTEKSIFQHNPLTGRIKCHIKDIITLTLKTKEYTIASTSFVLADYNKIQADTLVSENLEFCYNKEVIVSIEYSVQDEGLNFIDNLLSKMTDYDNHKFLVYSKLCFYLKYNNHTKIIIPQCKSDELDFILAVEKFLEKFEFFQEDLFYLKKYKENRAIDYLFLMELSFCQLPWIEEVHLNNWDRIRRWWINIIY